MRGGLFNAALADRGAHFARVPLMAPQRIPRIPSSSLETVAVPLRAADIAAPDHPVSRSGAAFFQGADSRPPYEREETAPALVGFAGAVFTDEGDLTDVPASRRAGVGRASTRHGGP